MKTCANRDHQFTNPNDQPQQQRHNHRRQPRQHVAQHARGQRDTADARDGAEELGTCSRQLNIKAFNYHCECA